MLTGDAKMMPGEEGESENTAKGQKEFNEITRLSDISFWFIVHLYFLEIVIAIGSSITDLSNYPQYYDQFPHKLDVVF